MKLSQIHPNEVFFQHSYSHQHTQTSELISESATTENQHSSCIKTNSSHLPKRSILKRVLDLQLLAKVKLLFLVFFFSFFSNKNGSNDMNKMIDFIEIENHSICRPKIYRPFQWLGGFNQRQAMATFTCNRIVRETWPPQQPIPSSQQSKPH